MFVADFWNNRNQLFQSGQLVGETVAGVGIPQNLTLNHPSDIVVDGDDYLYVADNHNHRVIRLKYGSWQCIVGCSRKTGSASNELRNAYSIRFDSHGNLFVADEHNSRIQKFSLTTNSCGKCGKELQNKI